MPLQIMHATVLYIRLLHNLDEAAHKKIHVNWMAFISHLMRTSYIYAPLKYLHRKNIPMEKDDLERDEQHFLVIDDFRRLNNWAYTKKQKYNHESVIPHDLMYSTLGRADIYGQIRIIQGNADSGRCRESDMLKHYQSLKEDFIRCKLSPARR